MQHNLIQSKPRALADEQHKIAIYWSPKAGCSTVAKIFLLLIGKYQNDIPVIKQRFEYIENTYAKCNGSLIKICNCSDEFYADYLKLQIVRNPYARAIGSFLKYLMVNAPKQLSFENYLTQIYMGKLIEHHMLPQYMTNKIDHILRLENLSDDINYINSIYNISLPYAFYDKESYKTYIKPEIQCNYSSLELGMTPGNIPYTINSNFCIVRGIPSYQYFYNDITINLVTEIYQKDIEYFKYTYPFTT